MAALIAQDTELALNVTRYTEPTGPGRPRRVRYRISRTDHAPGARYVTLTAGQLIGLGALIADLRERGFTETD